MENKYFANLPNKYKNLPSGAAAAAAAAASAAAAKSLQSCPTLFEPTRLPRPWDSPGKNTGVGCHFLLQCMKAKSERVVAQSCPTPSNLMDYSLPGSSIHGILQARVLEWGAIAFSSPLALAYIFSCSEIVPGAIQECRHTNSYNCG